MGESQTLDPTVVRSQLGVHLVLPVPANAAIPIHRAIDRAKCIVRENRDGLDIDVRPHVSDGSPPVNPHGVLLYVRVPADVADPMSGQFYHQAAALAGIIYSNLNP